MDMNNISFNIDGYLVGHSHYKKKNEAGEEQEWYVYHVLCGESEDSETKMIRRPKVIAVYKQKEVLEPAQIKFHARVRLSAYLNKEADGTTKTKYRDITVLN